MARILIDFDCVLNDLAECWVNELNRMGPKELDIADLKDYNMQVQYPYLSERQVYKPYLDGTLYMDIAPPDGAQKVLKKLSKKHDLYVCTANALGVDSNLVYDLLDESVDLRSFDYMLRTLRDYYPMIPLRNIIVTASKDMIAGDVIIDDYPGFLTGPQPVKILLDAPYNREFKEEEHGVHRAKDWPEVESLIKELVL